MENKRSAEEGWRMLAEFEASGLSRRQFCKQANVPLTTLDYWRWKKSQEARATRGLVEVTVEAQPRPETTSRMPFRIVLPNGRRIESTGDLNAALLSELIRIVENA